MSKLKFDIQSENLDLYFANEIAKLSDEERKQVPAQLLYKVHNRSGKYSHDAVTKLGFVGKIAVLVKGLKKRVYIVIEDEDGETIEEFSKLKKDLKSRAVTESDIKIIEGTYVLGGKELINTLSYIDDATSSPLYNYLKKLKNVPKNKIEKWGDEVGYVMKFLTSYEGRKKKWLAELGLNIQELMILIALYHGNEVISHSIYREIYKDSLYAGSTRMKTAFRTLQIKKLIVKYGTTKGATTKISPIGKDLLNKIMLKII